MEEKRELKLSKVIQMMDDGFSREEISVYFELNSRDSKSLWEHSSLKGRRIAAMKSEVNFIDDL